MGAASNTIRAKRRSSTVAALRKKAAAGETTGKERGLIRLGPANTRILTGMDDLSDWDDEELREGRRKDKNGAWVGRAPTIVPKALHDELVRRTLLNANEMMRENLEDAVRELVHIATSEACEAKDRLRAISMILDRVMGKAADKVEISGTVPWLLALQGGIVTVGDAVDEESEDDIDEADWEET
jgi:hypothetical protein